MRNFLWFGSDGSGTSRARVAWQTVILPQIEGSLGIIDPELQSQALLGKLVIRGLTPRGQTWKLLLQQGLSTCTPQRGGDWQPSIRWIFTLAPLTPPCSPFLRSLLSVWRKLRHALSQVPPSCQEEMDIQPLIWSSQVTDSIGLQLGERTHIPWASWARGSAH